MTHGVGDCVVVRGRGEKWCRREPSARSAAKASAALGGLEQSREQVALALSCSWPEERCCWYRVPDITPSWKRRWRQPGVVDPGSRRHWLFIYERVLAWNVWQANKYVKVRARRANVNMGTFLRPVVHPVRCPYNTKRNDVNVFDRYYALASATPSVSGTINDGLSSSSIRLILFSFVFAVSSLSCLETGFGQDAAPKIHRAVFSKRKLPIKNIVRN